MIIKQDQSSHESSCARNDRCFSISAALFLVFLFFFALLVIDVPHTTKRNNGRFTRCKKKREIPPPAKTATKVSYLFCYYYFPCVSIKKTEKLNPILSLLAWQYGPVAVKIFNVYKKLVSTLFFFCLFFFVVEKLEISLDQII